MRKVAIAGMGIANHVQSLVTMQVKEVEQLTKILAQEYGISNSQLKTVGKVVKVKTEPKIGRNEPCPCHSGKKYKNCCI